MNARQWRTGVVLVYLVALHAALAASLLRPDAVWRRLSLIWPWPPTETVSEFRRTTMATQSMLDLTVRPGAVWFFGDSIIQMMDTGRVTDRAINLGIGEDTVAGVLARAGDHSALASAAGIVLAIGINDLWYRSPDESARGYEALLTRLPRDKPVIASAVLPVNERARPNVLTGRNERIGRLNLSIARLCMARGNCRFVDAGPSLVDETGNLAPAMGLADGIHLSREGYRRLIDSLIAPVRDWIPRGG
jgi:lysophospholipase L1-like esterase